MSRWRPKRDALMEVFQTPNPSASAVNRWKLSWKHSGEHVRVNNYTSAIKLLHRMPEIDPLFYQVGPMGPPAGVSHIHSISVIFFKAEHATYFKLHQQLS
jgi:hypothetical protein